MIECTAKFNHRKRLWEVTLPNMDVCTSPTAQRLVFYLDMRDFVVVSQQDDQIVFRKLIGELVSEYRGFEIRKLAEQKFNIFKFGTSRTAHGFSTAWMCIMHIDELLSP